MALVLEDNTIKEQILNQQNTTWNGSSGGYVGDAVKQTLTTTSNYVNGLGGYYPYQNSWGTYPIYIYQDHTAKAIKILKDLESEGVIDVKTVAQFIKLVEKIAKTLA